MSLSEARFRAGVILKKGVEMRATIDVRRSFRREKLTTSNFSGVAATGKEIAAVGQMAAQV